jgi:choline dehydrogenase
LNDPFDYIIVGAGTAGCVLAGRLSERPDCRVLLLEAGPPPDDFWIRTPAGMAPLFNSKKFNWGFYSEPVPELKGRRVYFPRGKTLGGSSAVNGLVHNRGTRADYDEWARLGNTGWGWDDVLPLFKRLETNSQGAGPYHGGDGPLHVADPSILHPTVTDFFEAARRVGLPRVDRFSGLEPEGAGPTQINVHRGVRDSAYDAYVAPFRQRPNLVVMTDVRVRRVLFEGRVAQGVEAIVGGQMRRFDARAEVILCAGALQSPQLLMLSGIGDGAALQQHGIATRVHRPGVGRNLQDHCLIRMQSESTPGSSYNRFLSGWRKYVEGLRYIITHTGYLTMPSSPAMALVKSDPAREFGDLQFSFRPMTFSFDANGHATVDGFHGLGATVYRVRPASRGEVRLKSADPLDAPLFIPNFLQADEDVRAMVFGMRKLRSVFATEPLASRVVRELLPGPGVTTDEQLIDYLRGAAACAFHPAGTCKMGTDDMAVVDARLRVHGALRLRVVDASIMPTVTSGNTNAPVVMIGEKAADMVRADA